MPFSSSPLWSWSCSFLAGAGATWLDPKEEGGPYGLPSSFCNPARYLWLERRGNLVISINLVLMVVAFVLFVLAAIGVPSSRFSLIAGGLACWVLTELLGKLP